jgi:PAS domain S-box-containing protein
MLNDGNDALAELGRVKGLLWQREQLLENTEQGIWHLDNVGLTVYVNPAMCRLLGRDRGDILGRKVFDFFAGPDLAILNDQLEKRKLGHKRGYEIGITRPDGSRVECFNNATPIFDEAGGKLGSVGMWTDLTPLKQARREVDAALADSLVQRAEYEALLASFPGSIGVLDQDARYVFVNKSLAELIGRPAQDIIGRPAHEVVGPERAAVLVADFPRLRAGEVIVEIKEQPPADGLPGYVLRLNRVAGPPGADGRQLFYAFGIDISDMVKGEAKGAFLTHMSHEIRTPMNAIIGLTALALRTPLTLQQQDYLDKVQLAAHSLMGLLDDVLDLNKIESGKLQIEVIAFCLDEVLEGTAAVLGVLVEEKGLALRVSRQPDVPHQLMGDPLRLRQVLTNLIGNARKFTDHGSITVSTALASRHEDHVVLRFSVSDTGIGMSAEHQARLFQPFSQADESITRRFGGTGLGLAISRQLVELMGGRIGLVSEPGLGSTFSFELPFQLARPQDPSAQLGASADGVSHRLARPEPSALESIRGARILLVEDNATNQQVVVELLTQAGFSVEVASDGLQGLARLEASGLAQVPSQGNGAGGGTDGGFDCVLMDLQMPVMDGYAAAARIRANPAWTALPVLAISADVMTEDRERAARAGMNAHIAKPIEPRELFAALLKWIPPGVRKRPAGEAGTPAANSADRVLTPFVPGLELPQELIDATAQNPGLLESLLSQFLHDHANDGQAVRQALAAGDLQAAQRLAHALKGTGGSIGALAMAQRAGELEMALREGRHGALTDLTDALEATLAPLMAALRVWVEHALRSGNCA